MTPETVLWLDEHEGILHFATGKKVGLDFRSRRDGLRLQVSGWTVDEVIEAAQALERKRVAA